MNKLIHPLLCLYVAVAVFTFGHALNDYSIPDEARLFIAAPAGAIAWPLYWSWELQRKEAK